MDRVGPVRLLPEDRLCGRQPSLRQPAHGHVGKSHGTTYIGGAYYAEHSDAGTAFELSPTAKPPWTEVVLHSFCLNTGTNCADGFALLAGLIMDTTGNLYGTTSSGGAHNGGTVFELKP
jgi:uncharacterized repeat protein (TIGR03803 family)